MGETRPIRIAGIGLLRQQSGSLTHGRVAAKDTEAGQQGGILRIIPCEIGLHVATGRQSEMVCKDPPRVDRFIVLPCLPFFFLERFFRHRQMCRPLSFEHLAD